MPIVRLLPPHAAAYRDLMLDAYARHPDAFTSSVAERAALPLAWWGARLSTADDAPEAVWAALDGDTLQGVAGLSFERREKVRHKATLFGMYVRPACRGRGLGEQLLQAVLAAARARDDLQVVQLTVTQGNTPAVTLYESAGFVTYGCEPLAVRVGEGFVSKLHMACSLR
jgi:ribosomal protein S18 acetylase RimI-like enzyme